MQILYEIRIKKENEIAKEFVTSIKELSDCFRTNENDIIGLYKVYKEDEEIIKSERLKCVLKGNRLSIVTIKEKPKRIKPSSSRIISKEIVSEVPKKKNVLSKTKRFRHTLTNEIPGRLSKIQNSNREVSARSSKTQLRSNSKKDIPFRRSK